MDTPYQKRMRKFSWICSLYTAVFLIGFYALDAPKEYLLVFMSTWAVLLGLATGFDAVFDSLVERERSDEDESEDQLI